WSPVFLPGCQHGQFVETAGSIDDLRDRAARYGFRPEPEELSHQRPMLPEFSAIGRQQRLGNTHQLSDELFGLRAKGESIRFFVPKRFVATGKPLPFTFVKSSAGPPRS